MYALDPSKLKKFEVPPTLAFLEDVLTLSNPNNTELSYISFIKNVCFVILISEAFIMFLFDDVNIHIIIERANIIYIYFDFNCNVVVTLPFIIFV